MDLRMPDMSGIEAIAAIRAEFPHARITVLTTYSGDAHAAAALKAGAAGESNKLTAVELAISEGTVKTPMKSILPKLDAADRTHAVMIALRRGILDL
jgi:DNA-binding NarL/FixJ family response regulator